MLLALVALGIAGMVGLMAPAPQREPPDERGHGPVVGLGGSDAVGADLLRRLEADVRPLLSKSCYECHSSGVAKSGVILDAIGSMRDVMEQAKTLSTAREMIASGEMPPKGKTPLSDHQRLILDQWFEAALAYIPPDAATDPGWFTIHRLNREEYRNSIRDLLGLDVARFDPAQKLPKDDSGYGFDNNADVLTVSPLALEQYLDAAEFAVESALGPLVEVGGAPVTVPLSLGGGGSSLPGGGVHLYSNGAAQGSFLFPATGEYRISVVAWEDPGGDEHAALSLRLDGKQLRMFVVDADRNSPREFHVTTRVAAGTRSIAGHFTNDYWKKDVADRNLGIESISVSGPLDERTVERTQSWRSMFADARPGATEEARSTEILERFAARAYRAPLSPAQRESLLSLYRTRRALASGPTGFERAVRDALCGVLVSPSFLYRSIASSKPNDPRHIHTLTGHELASRLSYFLWSSTPDDRLLLLASEGSLTDPATLVAQTRRMLDDERSEAFVRNFVGQWLQLRTLTSLDIDRARFPMYTDELRKDFGDEASTFFADLVRHDGSALSLIHSDYTFANERLAEFYGLPEVKGPKLRRVALAPGSPRGGVLTMAGVLTVTSNTTRTSPVKRGLFVLDQILGTPPPPPPADIPPLEQAAHLSPNSSVREQLAIHVANPSCAACHNRLDPLGLAFEHFDAIGRWRDTENGRPIDASGSLPGFAGFTPLSGAHDVKQLLLSRGDQFCETLSGKLLMYALGRGLEPFDRPTVAKIAASAKAQEYRVRAIIEAVVLSETFRTCRGREPRHD